jgi:hypothetical protein
MLPHQTLTDHDWYVDELYFAWRAASAEADAAYAAWTARPDRDRYARYVAATDRADAAAEQLAAEHGRREGHGKGRSMHPVYAGSRWWN